MPLTLQQQLGELEDQLILGEILDSDYKQRKWAIIKQFRERGEIVRATGRVQLTEVVDSCGKIFCPVPPGPFVCGPNNEYGETKATYYCSKYPVTVKEFLEFLDDSGWPYGEEDIEALLLVSQDEDCPASHLSFNDAKEYCRWLRRKTQEYYALPLEIEWEKAARGEDGRYYPWGNEEPTPEWACYLPEDEENNGTVPVGSLEKNSSPYGCVGMVGNVWE
ncbi:MAG: SUMF1/EgtB/PvdO family nonheme iron enzyme, partial [Lentisphaeria bacterium]|nr:SUMF1/EgtB/PvdO family nonheme iron enzyme [Lentisphaeria bacterium]